ncbi:MAG TPA: DM13 domain-containing protein, partial [Flavisolibacter sp.]|nr:DM13 domain-containing protein [Flavisolibacter sp.]
LTLIAISCNKGTMDTPLPVPEPTPPGTVEQPINSGTLMNGPYGTVSGSINLYERSGSYVLGLKNFSTSAGPDLHVYVSKEMIPVNFIDLGKLKQNTGDQFYAIPGNPDFRAYRFALIHCQQYNHLFGYTELK